LWRCFREQKFDVVHVHTPVAALVGRVAAWLARVPLVVYTAHGFYFHDNMNPVKMRMHIFLERLCGRFTDILFTQSSEDARAAVENNIMPGCRVFAIGNGVDVSRFDPGRVRSRLSIRKEFGIPRNAYAICMIGRLVEEKGIIEFLVAASSLASRYKSVYFVLVGGRLPSDHDNSVDRNIKYAKNSIGDRLVLPGMRGDIPDILSAMDLFVLPSWREGMPRTIIEAMMMGLPVVATDIRGSREEVVDGETGLLVPVRDSVALGKAIERFILHPKWGRELGSAGRRRALSLYDESRVIARQVELVHHFHSLLNS